MATGVRANAGDSFDYVIVGSGAAGSVLAHRLTEQPGATVCVLEAGPPDRHPYIHVPAGFIKMLFNPDFTWQFKTEPSEGSGGRPIPTTQGRTLGGSSSINGMIYNRGQRADLDSWAQRGNRGWGYVDMLPYYKRTERRIGIADDRIHGREGNLPVTDIDWIHPICEAFIAGAVGMGIPRCVDYNSGDRQAGVGYFQRAIHRGWRHSAARVFLHPAKATGRLEIRTDARAAAVLFDGKRATGVRYVNDRDRTAQQRGACTTRGDPVLRHRQHGEAAADLRGGTGGAAGIDRRAGGARTAWRRRELPRSLRAAAGRTGAQQHHDQRAGARHGTGGPDAALGAGKTQHPRVEPVAGALVLEVGRQHGPARPAGRVQPGELQARVRRDARRLSGDDLRRMAASAREHRLRAGTLGRSVRRSGDPAELSGRSNGPSRA